MDFFSGLATGLQGMPQEIGQLQEIARRRKVAQALAGADFSGIDGNSAGPIDPGLQPNQPHPAAALAALAPQPQPAPPAAPNPRSRFPVTPGQPDPLAPQPSPARQAQPAPPQPDPNLSATAQPGIDFGNPIREANQTWQSIITAIKRANPKIDPVTLMGAAEQQLENIKGVAPLTKSIMYGQIQAQKMSFDYQYKTARLQQLGQKLEIDLKNATTKAQAEQALEEYHNGLLSIDAQRAEDYGRNVDYSHEDREAATTERANATSQTNQTRRDIEQGREETQKDIQGSRSKDSKYRSDQSVRGARIRAGVPDGPAPSGEGLGLPPDARKAPDGHYYAKRQGRWVRFD